MGRSPTKLFFHSCFLFSYLNSFLVSSFHSFIFSTFLFSLLSFLFHLLVSFSILFLFTVHLVFDFYFRFPFSYMFLYYIFKSVDDLKDLQPLKKVVLKKVVVWLTNVKKNVRGLTKCSCGSNKILRVKKCSKCLKKYRWSS
jgi:hypothetical protein